MAGRAGRNSVGGFRRRWCLLAMVFAWATAAHAQTLLTWDAPINSPVRVDGYRIYEDSRFLGETTTTSPGWTIDLSDGQPHVFGVSSINRDVATGSVLESAAATLNYAPTSESSPLTTPYPPSLLTVGPQSASALVLHWQDNSTDEIGFSVERRTGSGSYTVVATVGPNTALYLDSGLAAATPYTYRVSAFNGVGYSAYSNQASAATMPPSADTVPPVVSMTVKRRGNSTGYQTTATAVDNVALARIELLLDGAVQATCYASPCAATVAIKSNGSHVISAVAFDTTGNKSSAASTVLR